MYKDDSIVKKKSRNILSGLFYSVSTLLLRNKLIDISRVILKNRKSNVPQWALAHWHTSSMDGTPGHNPGVYGLEQGNQY
jgi:hypothetical protein